MKRMSVCPLCGWQVPAHMRGQQVFFAMEKHRQKQHESEYKLRRKFKNERAVASLAGSIAQAEARKEQLAVKRIADEIRERVGLRYYTASQEARTGNAASASTPRTLTADRLVPPVGRGFSSARLEEESEGRGDVTGKNT